MQEHREPWAAIQSRWPELFDHFRECDLGLRAALLAPILGLESPHALETELRMRRLPPFRLLRNWCYLVRLLEENEHGETISALALTRGRDPAMYYRFVRRTSGLLWTESQDRGSDWARATALKVWSPFIGTDTI